MENRVPPPLLTVAIGVLMWFAAADGPAPVWRSAAAILLLLAAGAFGLPAMAAFRRAKTTIDPVHIERANALVTGGIYRLTRNPMYVSLTLMLVAWALWLGGYWAWLGPAVLLAWLDRFQIRPEERVMSARFGSDYACYLQEVRRWL